MSHNSHASNAGQVEIEVQELLGERPLRIVPLHTGRRAQVLRCHLQGDNSVIVKSFTEVSETSRCEWDALSFLAAHSPPIAPRPLARSNDKRLLAMEDLRGETITSLLKQETVAGVKPPLVRTAKAIGHFHGAQVARRGELPPSLGGEYLKQARECVALGDKVKALLGRAAVEPAPGFDSAWRELVERMGSPGAFLTLTHGDLAPSNVLLTADGPRLLDFEYTGARSALYDVMFWEAIVPFPRALARAMTRAYRQALAAHLPEAREDACFHREMLTLKTHRFYWWLTFRLDEALAGGEAQWVPGWRLRTAYLFYTQSYVTTAGRLGERGPLLRTAQALFSRLKRGWKERAGYPDHFFKPSDP